MKFINANIIISNPIPDETRIYYSKNDALLKLLLLLAYCGVGIYSLIIGGYVIGLPLCLFTAFLICKKGKKLIDNKPRVIINQLGITTSHCPFVTWQEVTDAKVICKGRISYLTYKFAGGNKAINIDHLNITPDDMTILLGFYMKPWAFVPYRK